MNLSFDQAIARISDEPTLPMPGAFSADGAITDVAHARRFMLAGNATFTVVSKNSGQRFTYRIRASEDGAVHFVSLLNGADNESSYAYFGYIRREIFFHGGAKARVSRDAPSAKAFDWLWRCLQSQDHVPRTVEIWHEGRCGRCNRKLTVPESIRTGLGPECAGRVQ